MEKNLKLDKKNYKHTGIYNIECITIKQFDEYNKINSVNILSLMSHSVTAYFKEQDENKYLILDLRQKFKYVENEKSF